MPVKTPETTDQIESFLQVYQGTVRPVLANLSPDRIEELDAQAKRVAAAGRLVAEPITVCFLGRAGVGKSTLINALTAGKDLILPSGGIGTLTAQATRVVHSEEQRFTVRYHGLNKLNQVAFGLQKMAEREAGRVTALDALPFAADADGIARDLENEETRRETQEALLKQSRLMVKGKQDAEATMAYLADAIASVFDRKPVFGSQLLPDDRERLERLSQAANLAKEDAPYVCSKSTCASFQDELTLHAAGFLSPLIRELEVGWPAGILKAGVQIVDLPGVGTFNDLHKKVTEDYVRQKARAIVLVVDRSGADEASAELLISSGFLYRLLHSADSPEVDPVLLVMVAVQMDMIADTNYAKERQDKPGTARKKVEHLKSVREQMRTQLQQGLNQLLHPMMDRHGSNAGIALSQVIERLVQSTSYHAVSATEYRKLLAEDDDDRAFISDPAQSGIPALHRALVEEIEKHHQMLLGRAVSECHGLGERIWKDLEFLRAEREGGLQDRARLESLREEFRLFRASKEKELASRAGAFREFLKEGVAQSIEGLVGRAALEGQKDFTQYLRGLGQMHHGTLLASVRKGGVHCGVRSVELPKDFSQILEAQLVPLWNEEVLKAVRRRTKELAESYVSILDDFREWVKQHQLADEIPLVDALCQQISSDANTIAERGHEGSEDLRKTVRDGLYGHLRDAIRSECERFVASSRDRGTGAKSRALDFFQDLIPKIEKVSQRPVTNLFKEAFSTVEQEIRTLFERYSDPLQKVGEILFDGREMRSESQEKETKHQLAQITSCITSLEAWQ
jgi:GTP-binding protein EngB required for normal cell division